jgi:hypothetical protein
MKTTIILACLAMVVLSRISADAADTYHKSSTPRCFTEWVRSDDGKVSASFVVDKTTFATNETIRLRCAIVNNGDKALTVLRPFGDGFYTLAYGLSILGPDGLIPYRGPMKEYVLGTSAFIELQPGMVVEDQIELPPDIFLGLGVEGLYVIGNEYQSDGYPKQPAPNDFWKGKIKTKSVTVLVGKKAPNKPSEATR